MSLKQLTIILSTTFFILGLVTLPHYGINWDTINHLPRGQAFLHFFLTGKKNYDGLPKWQSYFQNPASLGIDTNLPKGHRPDRSFYKSDPFSFNDVLRTGGKGHPALSDIFSALFNVILFEKLGFINDIDAYRVYGILLACCLVGLIFWWTAKIYGKFAGLIAAVSLSLYPLFWSESHFNSEKDIPETVYWSFLLFSVWYGVTQKNYKWILAAGIFLGFALGTKFNIFFVPLVIIPWLLLFLVTQYLNQRFSVNVNSCKKFILKNLKFCFSLLASPFIGIAIFIGIWPYLWLDPIVNLTGIFKYYKEIGLTTSANTDFLGPFGINTYAVQWIVYTTPLVILFLALIGVFAAFFRFKSEKDKVSLLFLLWLLVPILRVTWPGTTIYGGVRQIMEYLPALAIFAGIGGGSLALFLSSFIKNFRLTALMIILLFVPHIVKLVSIHPNENVYFNSLIGGLQGAKDKNLPSWGNSFGAPYRQGIIWLNENVPPNGKVVFVRELMPNIPVVWLRPDINFHNSYRSGYLQKGEYAIGLTYQGTKDASYYDGFLETFVKPVYEVKVDNVGILKIWKNDKSELAFDPKEQVQDNASLEKLDSGLKIDLGKIHHLSRLEIHYSENNCQPLSEGIVRISQDGKNWQSLIGVLPRYWRVAALQEQPANGGFIEPFYGQSARFIDLILSPEDTCLKNVEDFKIYYFSALWV